MSDWWTPARRAAAEERSRKGGLARAALQREEKAWLRVTAIGASDPALLLWAMNQTGAASQAGGSMFGRYQLVKSTLKSSHELTEEQFEKLDDATIIALTAEFVERQNALVGVLRKQ